MRWAREMRDERGEGIAGMPDTETNCSAERERLVFVNLMGKSLSIKHTVTHQERNQNGLEGQGNVPQNTHGRDLSRFHDPSC